MAYYALDNENNRVEIYFDSIPSEEIRIELKANGWRWFGVKKCWYTRQSGEAISFAERICSGALSSTIKQTKQTTNSNKIRYIMPEMTKRYCYADTVSNFINTQETEWLFEMKNGFSEASCLRLEIYKLEFGKIAIVF